MQYRYYDDTDLSFGINVLIEHVRYLAFSQRYLQYSIQKLFFVLLEFIRNL